MNSGWFVGRHQHLAAFVQRSDIGMKSMFNDCTGLAMAPDGVAVIFADRLGARTGRID